MIRQACSRFLRVGGSTVLLSLPLAYVPEQPEGQDTFVGLYGGAGQAVSVVRGCSGPAFDPLANEFAEVSGVAAVREDIGQGARIVLSLRGGYFRSRASYPFGASNPPPPASLPEQIELERAYGNPAIAVESRWVGFGLGAFFGSVPASLDYPEEDDMPPVSAHLRVGKLNTVYASASLMENMPLVSGGGLFDAGIGYRLFDRLQLFSGFSLGFYNESGFLQQLRVGVTPRLNLDVSGRLGKAEGQSEYGVSLGLNYRFGK